MDCIRLDNYDPASSQPPPCSRIAHCRYLHGCQCDACEQLERAIKEGELKADDATIKEYERSMLIAADYPPEEMNYDTIEFP